MCVCVCVFVCVQSQRPEAWESSPGWEEQHQDSRLRHGLAPGRGQPVGDQLWVSTGLSTLSLIILFYYCTIIEWQSCFRTLLYSCIILILSWDLIIVFTGLKQSAGDIHKVCRTSGASAQCSIALLFTKSMVLFIKSLNIFKPPAHQQERGFNR